jgi:hypothetical protein
MIFYQIPPLTRSDFVDGTSAGPILEYTSGAPPFPEALTGSIRASFPGPFMDTRTGVFQ